MQTDNKSTKINSNNNKLQSVKIEKIPNHTNVMTINNNDRSSRACCKISLPCPILTPCNNIYYTKLPKNKIKFNEKKFEKIQKINQRKQSLFPCFNTNTNSLFAFSSPNNNNNNNNENDIVNLTDEDEMENDHIINNNKNYKTRSKSKPNKKKKNNNNDNNPTLNFTEYFSNIKLPKSLNLKKESVDNENEETEDEIDDSEFDLNINSELIDNLNNKRNNNNNNNDSLLQSIILKQHFDGSFSVISNLERIVPLFAESEIEQSIPKSLSLFYENSLRKDIWLTVLVIQYLALSLSDLQLSWEMIADKSKLWLRSILKTSGVDINILLAEGKNYLLQTLLV